MRCWYESVVVYRPWIQASLIDATDSMSVLDCKSARPGRNIQMNEVPKQSRGGMKSLGQRVERTKRGGRSIARQL
jgi:hypothetical protein